MCKEKVDVEAYDVLEFYLQTHRNSNFIFF